MVPVTLPAPAPAPATADPMLPVVGHVRRRRKETHDTFTLDLTLDQNAGFAYRPGQINMLYVFGAGEVPISISGDPAKPHVLTHTVREVGTVTRAMGRLRRGDAVGIRGPYGNAWPVEAAEGHDVVIIAGGIGLAPLRPAMYHMLAHRERYQRVVLLYGARTPEDLLFRKEIGQWRARFDLDVRATVDRAGRQWRGNVGVITTLIPRAPFDPERTVALICGPEIMMRFTVQELVRRGVSLDRIYVTMERNMKCAIGLCGHCQFGPGFVCKDGPIFRFDQIAPLFYIRGL